jgi:putative transcriptional regulator
MLYNYINENISVKGDMKNFLKENREAKGLTQDELAHALHVSRQTIISIEKGRYIASLQLALLIAAYFQLPVETIFKLEKDNKK